MANHAFALRDKTLTELHLECDPTDYEEPWQAKMAGRADKQMDKQTQSRLTDGDGEMDGWFVGGWTDWLMTDRGINRFLKIQVFPGRDWQQQIVLI